MSAFLDPPPIARAFGRAIQNALLRAEQARAIRETRALYPNDIRAWRNSSARFAARVVEYRATHDDPPKREPLATRPCGHCHWHRACTCPL